MGHLTILVKKGEKPAEVATKKMETMASRLPAIAATKLDSNPEEKHSIRLRDKITGGVGKAEPRKSFAAGGPHLIVDLEKCEQV